MSAALKKSADEFVRLIADRIRLLKSEKRLSIEEQIEEARRALGRSRVPERLWRSVVVECMAAMAKQDSRRQPDQSRCVTLIGGEGMMGRFLRSRFEEAEHRVTVLEQGDWGQADALLGEAELALVCVPIEATDTVIRNAARHIRPNAVLADITSIKEPPVKAMLTAHPGPVVGLHPMFGPRVNSFLSQRVVVCHGRQREAYRWLLDLIERDGGKLVEATPEEHDRMMVTVQAIRHFTTFCLGVYLADARVDVNRTLEFSSPIYRLEVDVVARLFAQDASLYIDIMLAIPERRKAIRRLAMKFSELAASVERVDRAGLIGVFEQTRESLGREAVRALDESAFAVEALATILAARDVEQHQAGRLPQE